MSERKRKIKNFMNSNVEASKKDFVSLEQLASKYDKKNENEMLDELRRLNKEMAQDKEKYKKNMENINELKGYLDEEQKSKLKKIKEFLNPTEK